MSRTPWWSLTALLAVVAGLLCGPAAFGGAGEGGVRAASAVRVLAQDAGRAAGAAAARTPMGPAPAFAVGGASAPASPPGAVEAGAPASAPGAAGIGVPAEAEAAAEDAPVPGCGKLRDHDGEPAVPSRARGGHDQAPGLAPWGLPAATGAPSAEPPPGVRARAPAPYTPTPVELSVLRV
ncbi:hypothetical protein ACF058_08500 [Streptomyces sp. NPDC015501]|uniref:hypothetical protein n=1 Tax=unclassified Streptomyces TaxID=2593676 RepID=UPI0011A3C853|nr:hypothetical protein A3L22_06405 [Streptomyces griseus subsp. griseus]